MLELSTYSESVDHGLESEVDLASADDLGDVLKEETVSLLCVRGALPDLRWGHWAQARQP